MFVQKNTSNFFRKFLKTLGVFLEFLNIFNCYGKFQQLNARFHAPKILVFGILRNLVLTLLVKNDLFHIFL